MAKHKFCKLETSVRFRDGTPLSTQMDKNYYSIADESFVKLEGITIDSALPNPKTGEVSNPAEIDDVLKLSHAQSVEVKRCLVEGHGVQRENAVDMNRECFGVQISDTTLVSGLQNAVTIKGGCDNIILERVQIVPGHGHCDVELGNWSDQSKKRTTRVVLDSVTRTDGEPIRLRVGNADYPVIINCEVDYLWFQSLLLKAYVFFKGKFS